LVILVVGLFGGAGPAALQGNPAAAFLMMEGEVRANRDRDAAMDRLLRAELGREPAATPEACPPADHLAAYLERALSERERETVEDHLAGCARCQDALAALSSMPETGAAVDVAPAAGTSWWRQGLGRWLVPLTVAATAAFVYVAVRPDEGPRPAAQRDQVAASARAEIPPAGAESRPAAPLTARDLGGSTLRPNPSRDLVPAPEGARAAKPARAGERQAEKEATPAPPATGLAQEQPAPVATLVGARPSAAATKDAAKTETREQAVETLPVVGGVVGGELPGRAGAEGLRSEPGKPAGAATPGRMQMAKASLDAPLVVVSKGSPDVRWRLAGGASIEGSTDGGRSWHLQYAGLGQLNSASSPSPGTCWAVGDEGLVLLTTDGEMWTTRPFPTRVQLVAVVATDALRATVTARDGRMFATEDSGYTWGPARRP
jgi:hypothetical protein